MEHSPVFYSLNDSVRLIGFKEEYPVTAYTYSGGSLDSTLTSQHVLTYEFKVFRVSTLYPSHPTIIEVMVPESGAGLPVAAGGGSHYFAGLEGSTHCVGFSIDSDAGEDYYIVKLCKVVGNSQVTSQTTQIATRMSSYNGTNYVDTWGNIVVDATRYDCQDAAVDSRKGSGVANSEGGHYPQANWSSKNLNFGGYTFHGGLFVGNMPPAQYNTSGVLLIDRSGTSRTQLWPQGLPTGVVAGTFFASVTALDMGVPELLTSTGGVSIGSGYPTIGVYATEYDDPFVSKTESNATWDQRWTLTSSGSDPLKGPGPHPPDISGLEGTYLTDGGEYLNWPLTRVDETSGTATYSTPDYTYGLSLALVDEDTEVGNGAVVWRYLASREWAGTRTLTFPKSDAGPRLWVNSITGTWTP